VIDRGWWVVVSVTWERLVLRATDAGDAKVRATQRWRENGIMVGNAAREVREATPEEVAQHAHGSSLAGLHVHA
jgi:hypothetical protein